MFIKIAEILQVHCPESLCKQVCDHILCASSSGTNCALYKTTHVQYLCIVNNKDIIIFTITLSEIQTDDHLHTLQSKYNIVLCVNGHQTYFVSIIRFTFVKSAYTYIFKENIFSNNTVYLVSMILPSSLNPIEFEPKLCVKCLCVLV